MREIKKDSQFKRDKSLLEIHGYKVEVITRISSRDGLVLAQGVNGRQAVTDAARKLRAVIKKVRSLP
jgi:hypothetical protein